MQSQLDEIISILTDLVGNDNLYFDTALEGGEFLSLFTVWAVCTNGKQVAVMDAEENWHELTPDDVFVPEVLRKVQKISTQYAKASNQ